MPKLKLGAAVYAVVGVAGLVQVVRAVRHDGPWQESHGWLLLIGLTVLAFGLSLLQDGGQAWPVGPAVFVPHFVRKLQESCYEGRASAGERPAVPESAA